MAPAQRSPVAAVPGGPARLTGERRRSGPPGLGSDFAGARLRILGIPLRILGILFGIPGILLRIDGFGSGRPGSGETGVHQGTAPGRPVPSIGIGR
ncbi:hypothetical protein J3R03_007343 [Actinoplanes couchii]|uniref:Uncharacterized protein n=1 Tax=Actinoplanes couchii TaxID=403638 RepID=A0ABQ3XAW5_9ACTN|nr:hypothetical protein [Actinoplanes couchii]GID55661.1 hypothetical protein Aco03nite_040650 [Actinoplanes couchii]